MEIAYERGTLLWYWFEYWIGIGGSLLALGVAFLVVIRSGWGLGGMLLKVWMLAAVVAALPLTLARLGVTVPLPRNLAPPDDLTVGYLSLGGVVGALLVGLPYLFNSNRLKDDEWLQRVGPLYQAAALVCDHFSLTLAQNPLIVEQMTATDLVLEELPSKLKEVRASPKPRSRPELPISSCLGPSNAPSSTRAIVVSRTDAVNHPIKLTKPSVGVVS